jgi:predicted ATPase
VATPELESLTVKGFKSFSSLEKLELRATNIVIGPNGSGKSNLIEVFAFLHAIREGRLQEYVVRAGGAEKLLHFGSKVTEEIHIHISFRGGLNQYTLELAPTDADELIPWTERIYFWDKKGHPKKPFDDSLSRRGKEAGISDPDVKGIGSWIRHRLAQWRLYHFQDTSRSSPMKKTANVNDNRFLREDGSNLAAFLFFLRVKHRKSYDLIRRTVQRVAPFFDDFVLEPMRLNEKKIQLEWRHTKSNEYFDVSSLSDGTLRFIALTTLFLQPDKFRPSVVLVDEPELGLHPYAITMLASLIRSAAQDTDGDTQVIVATQSPLLLDHFEPQDVIVADRVGSHSRLTRPDPKRLSKWLKDYSLGQLWEKNELGGRPS